MPLVGPVNVWSLTLADAPSIGHVGSQRNPSGSDPTLFRVVRCHISVSPNSRGPDCRADTVFPRTRPAADVSAGPCSLPTTTSPGHDGRRRVGCGEHFRPSHRNFFAERPGGKFGEEITYVYRWQDSSTWPRSSTATRRKSPGGPPPITCEPNS